MNTTKTEHTEWKQKRRLWTELWDSISLEISKENRVSMSKEAMLWKVKRGIGESSVCHGESHLLDQQCHMLQGNGVEKWLSHHTV